MLGSIVASAFLLLASAMAQTSTSGAFPPQCTEFCFVEPCSPCGPTSNVMSILPISVSTPTPGVTSAPSLTDSIIVPRPGIPTPSSVSGSASIPAGETPIGNSTISSATTIPTGNATVTYTTKPMPTPSSAPSPSSAAIPASNADGKVYFFAAVVGFAWALI